MQNSHRYQLGVLLSIILFTAACSKAPLLSKAKNSEDAQVECEKLSQDNDYEEASKCFEILKSRYGGSAHAIEADLNIADNYFRKKDFLLAAETYLGFAKIHPAHPKVGYAYFRAGLSYLRGSPKAIDRDQQYLDGAIQYLELAMSYGGEFKDVAREKWKEARLRQAERHYYVGRFYYRTGEYQSAINRLMEISTHYTDLGLDEKALYLLGQSYLKMNDKDHALQILGVFEQHFPTSEYRKKLAKSMGVQ